MPRKSIAIIAAVVACCAAACGYTIQQYLNIHGNYQGYWLPDDEVIFRNKTTGVTQAWRTNAATGRPEQITFFDEGVSYAVAHPVTGKVLAAADVGGDERDQLYLMNDDGSGVEALTDNPEVIYRYGDWSRDGRYVAVASNERDERYFDVYVYDVETGGRRLVMQHDGYNSPLVFSPDGYELIVFRYNGSQDGDLYLIDLETGKTRHLTPHEGELEIGAVTWAADGYGIYFTSDEGRDFLRSPTTSWLPASTSGSRRLPGTWAKSRRRGAAATCCGRRTRTATRSSTSATLKGIRTWRRRSSPPRAWYGAYVFRRTGSMSCSRSRRPRRRPTCTCGT